MAELFSEEWMNQLKDAWNADPEVKDKLAEINFSSVITCGYKDEGDPRGVFVVENGECVRAGSWGGEDANWDMRAAKKDWMKWLQKRCVGIGMRMARQTSTNFIWM